MNDKKVFADRYLGELTEDIGNLDSKALARAITWFRQARDEGKRIFVCGNGGSASIASHMVADILKGASYGRDRKFKIIGLSDSIATITAYANDVDYGCVFVEQLKNFAEPEDVLLAMSGSGNSENIVRAVEFANDNGLRNIGITTGKGGRLRDISGLPITIPSTHMGRLEDCFMIAVHVICYAFMEDEIY